MPLKRSPAANALVLTVLQLATVCELRAAANFPAYGTCRATGQDSLIDDMEDGDYRPSASEDRLGIWYTFNPGGSCDQQPVTTATTRFTMSADASHGGAYTAATQGRSCTGSGWSGGGLGIKFLSQDTGSESDSVACDGGYDASSYRGLSFALKAASTIRVQVCTSDVKDFNCHGYEVTSSSDSWRDIVIPWSQFLQEDWGPTTQTVAFNPAHILSVQFKALTPDFAIAVDDLKFLQEQPGGDTGNAGQWFAFKPQDIFKQQLQTEYENWKSKYLVACDDGSADVRKEGSQGVSEGTGYGMLLAASLDDQSTFEKLNKGFQKRRNPRGMMSWQFSVCGGAWGDHAATDGDLDIAMALIIADGKWGSYRAVAEPLISAIKQYATAQCDGLWVLRPGDNWGSCLDAGDQRLNPSYFAPAYYRAFSRYVPNQAEFWQLLAYDSYRLLDGYQKDMDGVFPDWAYASGARAGEYGYEACRVPWRIAMDYAWYGEASAARVLRRTYDFAAARGGPAAASSQKNSCFIGGLALTATAVSQEASDDWYRQWIGGIPQAPDPTVGDNPYFQGTLRVLYLALAGSQLRP